VHLAVKHPWNLSPEEAIVLQQRLASQVRETPLPASPRTVGGIDVSFPDRDTALAAVVILSYPDQTPLAQATAKLPATFPYVPGLLSFRETPVVLAALEKLSEFPDVFICDAQGRAHPRRLGLASHLGLLLDHPTIGCAKSRLIGSHGQLPTAKGAQVPLYDGKEQIGAVVRTRTGVKPVYVSVGHRVSLVEAVEIVLTCSTRYRLPEPTRLAHQVAAGKYIPIPHSQLFSHRL